MLRKDRLGRIAGLALPIIGGMVSQNVLNLVDTAMVGTLGNAALAAVGLGGFVTFMSMALILGVSTGVQAMAARRKGAGQHGATAVPLNAGMLLVLSVAPLLTIGLVALAPTIYPLLNADEAVIEHGVPYLRVRLLAMTFVGLNFAFRGYWNAVDLARLYMGTLLVMHTINIAVSYVLIFGKLGLPPLGTTGAAIGTSVSVAIGTALYLWLGFRHARMGGFLHSLPRRNDIVTLVRLALPSGLQQFFFAAGFVATYWIIGLVGTAELAAANVLINVTLVAILPGLGFGLAAATLVGQALGRGDGEDAYRWGIDVMKTAAILMTALGLPMWLVPDLILAVFIHDPATIDIGRLPMRLVGLTMTFEAAGMVFMHALLGAGDVRRVMLVAIGAQWIVFLPLAFFVGPVLGLGLVGIWVLQGGSRMLQAGVLWRLWQGRRWAAVRV